VLAQGLSQRECSEIQAIYQITPPQCGVGVNSVSRVSLPQIGTQPTRQNMQNNIFFNGGGTQLDPTAIAQMQRLATVLNTPEMTNACIRLVGHSDASGSAVVNLEISLNRAIAVRNMLAPLLSNPTRIQDVRSDGETRPLLNLPAESAWQRRVSVWARDCNS